VKRPLLIPLLLLAAACSDPPCPDYWRPGCEEHCAGDQVACDALRGYAEGALREEGACRLAVSRFEGIAAQPGGPALLCRLPLDGAPPDPALMGVPLRCDRIEFELGIEEVRVGNDRFAVVQMSDRMLNLRVGNGVQNSCIYVVASDAVTVDCAAPLGALGADPVRCTPQRRRRR
jgi:hypothetical protein